MNEFAKGAKLIARHKHPRGFDVAIVRTGRVDLGYSYAVGRFMSDDSFDQHWSSITEEGAREEANRLWKEWSAPRYHW